MNPSIRDILVALIAAMGVLGGQYLVSMTAQETAQTVELEALYGQQARNRQLITQQADEIVGLKTQVRLQELQLDAQYSVSPGAVLSGFLDAIESPAWCKEVIRHETKPVEFRMFDMNGSYRVFYKVSEAFYVGKTDFEVYPEEIAQPFYDNDLTALIKKTFTKFAELVPLPEGGRGYRDFWKFWHMLPDKTELLCGVQLST